MATDSLSLTEEEEEEDDADLLIDLSQHGFDFQASQTNWREAKQAKSVGGVRERRKVAEVGHPRVPKASEVVDLVSPEPAARPAPSQLGEERANSCVVTIDLCTTSTSSEGERGRELVLSV